MSDFASLLRFAQQSAQTPQLHIDPSAGLGTGSLSQAYQTLHQSQPAQQPLFQPSTLPLPPPRIAQPVPFPDDGNATIDPSAFQPQFLLEQPVPFNAAGNGSLVQGTGAGKGGPIIHGAGPSAASGSVTSALTRVGLLGG